MSLQNSSTCGIPLSIHNSAGAESVPHTLVITVPRGSHILPECFQSADSDHINNILRIPQSFPAISGGLNLNVKAIVVDISLGKLSDHVQIAFIDVGKGDSGYHETQVPSIDHEAKCGKPNAPAPINETLKDIASTFLS